MHDRKGRPLAVGDVIIIPYVITSTSETEDYCNISAQSLYGRKPDGMKECFSGNAAVVLKAEITDVSEVDDD